MILKIVYHNPNPSGPNIYLVQDALDYQTRNRELWIWRQGSSKEGRPDVLFSVGQWICLERQPDNEEESAPESRAPAAGRRPAPNGGPRRRRPSDLNDLGYSTPEAVERTRQASMEFAVDNLVVPWSDAHMRALLDYEKEVAAAYGPDAIKELPWNKVPRASDKV